MPELPEVETVCRTLSPLLTGRRIRALEVLWPRTISTEPGRFNSCAVNKEIIDVSRRAKLIRVIFSDACMLTIHLRMTGELLWIPPSEQPDPAREPYLRAAFLLDDESTLQFYDVRKFGRIACLNAAEARELDAYFGVEPLSPEFTAGWLEHRLASKRRMVKPLLLDQTFIAGLGNIYVDESLFLAGIHPMTRSDLVSLQQARLLHSAIQSVLTGALERRGTTLRDYRSGLGETGGNRPRLLVYGSKPGTACPKCGTPLERLVVGQRGSIFCPGCQSLAASGKQNR